LPSELLAAYLYAQFEAREQIQSQRQRIWGYYNDKLPAWAEEHRVTLPAVPVHCEQPFHMYYILMPSLVERQGLIDHLKARGILSVFHYLPLNLSDMGRKFGGRPGECPVTEDVSDRLLRLPFYNDLTEAEQAEVVDAMLAFEGWQ
jgi:dTDP-4-amino-4,6-dideoxygalactose transaminase